MKVEAKHIPPEVGAAFRAATPGWHWAWNTEPSLAAAIAAALAAWPGATHQYDSTIPGVNWLDLPLPPQEASDDQ